MNVVFVRADALRAIHQRLIATYGGLSGVRDNNALESAVARPRPLLDYEGLQSIPRLAAALSWALLRNRPFADGNKRIALASIAVFLDLNGYALFCSEVEETAMILRAASRQFDENAWVAWLERVAHPR